MNKAFGIISSCIFITTFAVSIALLNANDGNTSNHITKDAQNMNGSIFGVRWRLGDAFALQQTYQNNEYYVLNFNSHTSLNAQTYVRFKNSSFACTEQRHSSQHFATYVHTCRINQKLFSPYEYQIVSKVVQITGEGNNTHIESSHQNVRFAGKLRVENLGESILILGDIFFQENGTLLCDIGSILERNNISIVVIGNIYPAITEDNYQQILTFLEPITSQAMIIPVNQINPQTQLFPLILFPLSQSTLEKYYNTISFNRLNITILTVNSNLNVSEIISKLSDQEKEILKNSLALQISSIPSIGNSILYQPIRTDMHIFTQSTHTFSKRTLCSDDIHQSDIDDQMKRKMCPLIIVEGRIDMNSQMQDYGVLHFEVAAQYKRLSFDHYSQCLSSDQFEFKYNQINQQSTTSQSDNKVPSLFHKIIIAAEYIIIIFLVLFILVTFLILRKKAAIKKKSEDKHVELVQEIVAGSQPPQK